MKKSYYELLRDPRWQKKRLEVFERSEFRCDNCGSEDEELHAHHTYYEQGRMPWEYETESFRTYCRSCHDKVETLKKQTNKMLQILPFPYQELIFGLVSGISQIEAYGSVSVPDGLEKIPAMYLGLQTAVRLFGGGEWKTSLL